MKIREYGLKPKNFIRMCLSSEFWLLSYENAKVRP